MKEEIAINNCCTVCHIRGERGELKNILNEIIGMRNTFIGKTLLLLDNLFPRSRANKKHLQGVVQNIVQVWMSRSTLILA